MITEFAPAKINLALHVTGRRDDGYHSLSSLVAFVSVGDVVTVRPSAQLRLTLSGPFADALNIGNGNLVQRAAELFEHPGGAHIHLEKNLPVSSGIGGGSADAAATLRALHKLWGQPIPDALRLGADVPVCLRSQTTLMKGIGDELLPLPHLPETHIVLLNPGFGLSTPEVFAARKGAFSEPLPPLSKAFASADELAAWLNTTRNDLTLAAMSRAPDLQEVLSTMGKVPGCLLARMSGSGATCFGLFAEAAKAQAAADALARAYPYAWIRAGKVINRLQYSSSG